MFGVASGSTKLWRNKGDGTFETFTGAPSVTNALDAAFCDYNNDNLLDLFISTSGALKLYQNAKTGNTHSFTAVTGHSFDTTGGYTPYIACGDFNK